MHHDAARRHAPRAESYCPVHPINRHTLCRIQPRPLFPPGTMHTEPLPPALFDPPPVRHPCVIVPPQDTHACQMSDECCRGCLCAPASRGTGVHVWSPERQQMEWLADGLACADCWTGCHRDRVVNTSKGGVPSVPTDLNCRLMTCHEIHLMIKTTKKNTDRTSR